MSKRFLCSLCFLVACLCGGAQSQSCSSISFPSLECTAECPFPTDLCDAIGTVTSISGSCCACVQTGAAPRLCQATLRGPPGEIPHTVVPLQRGGTLVRPLSNRTVFRISGTAEQLKIIVSVPNSLGITRGVEWYVRADSPAIIGSRLFNFTAEDNATFPILQTNVDFFITAIPQNGYPVDVSITTLDLSSTVRQLEPHQPVSLNLPAGGFAFLYVPGSTASGLVTLQFEEPEQHVLVFSQRGSLATPTHAERYCLPGSLFGRCLASVVDRSTAIWWTIQNPPGEFAVTATATAIQLEAVQLKWDHSISFTGNSVGSIFLAPSVSPSDAVVLRVTAEDGMLGETTMWGSAFSGSDEVSFLSNEVDGNSLEVAIAGARHVWSTVYSVPNQHPNLRITATLFRVNIVLIVTISVSVTFGVIICVLVFALIRRRRRAALGRGAFQDRLLDDDDAEAGVAWTPMAVADLPTKLYRTAENVFRRDAAEDPEKLKDLRDGVGGEVADKAADEAADEAADQEPTTDGAKEADSEHLLRETPAKGLRGSTGDVLSCVVCLDAPRECLVLECGHSVLCTECAQRLWTAPVSSRRCPMCRQPFVAIMRLVSLAGIEAQVLQHPLLPDTGQVEPYLPK